MRDKLAQRVLRWCLMLPLLVPCRAAADVRGMVLRVQGERIVINRGLQSGLRPGAMLYITDSSTRPVAQVRVTQVDDHSSEVAIVRMAPNAQLGVGNSVSDVAFAEGELERPHAQPTPAAAIALTSDPSPVPTASPVDPAKGFEDVLKQRTKIYSFQGGKGGVIKVEATDVLNLLSTVVSVGRGASMINNPWLLTTTAYDYWERYNTTSNMNQKARTTMEVVYWDEGLANAYADYYVYKETYLDAPRKAEVRQSLLSQKGVTTSAVFQVRIRNRGPGTLQISPFDWHFYLLDAEGNRVKAERYDEVLDKSLNVGQDVQGYVYFPKRDPLGRPYVSEPVKVMVEDIFGERTLITWVTRPPQDTAGSSRGRGKSESDEKETVVP